MNSKHCRIIHQNGITFTSSTFSQDYFRKTRSNRLEKKLKVGKHLVLVFRHHMVVNIKDIKERYGDNYCFEVTDKLIDISYSNNKLRKDLMCSLCTSKVCSAQEKEVYTSFWEISSPDKKSYDNAINTIKENINNIIPHKETTPLFFPFYIYE